MLTCIDCGREFDPEGWDPLGGDCPVVVDESGTVIAPNGEFVSVEDYRKANPE